MKVDPLIFCFQVKRTEFTELSFEMEFRTQKSIFSERVTYT